MTLSPSYLSAYYFLILQQRWMLALSHFAGKLRLRGEMTSQSLIAETGLELQTCAPNVCIFVVSPHNFAYFSQRPSRFSYINTCVCHLLIMYWQVAWRVLLSAVTVTDWPHCGARSCSCLCPRDPQDPVQGEGAHGHWG